MLFEMHFYSFTECQNMPGSSQIDAPTSLKWCEALSSSFPWIVQVATEGNPGLAQEVEDLIL